MKKLEHDSDIWTGLLSGAARFADGTNPYFCQIMNYGLGSDRDNWHGAVVFSLSAPIDPDSRGLTDGVLVGIDWAGHSLTVRMPFSYREGKKWVEEALLNASPMTREVLMERFGFEYLAM